MIVQKKSRSFMSPYQYISYRNLKFLLFEMLEADKNISKLNYYRDYDRSAFEMSLDTAQQISDIHLFPYYMEMDRKKAVFDNGKVTTHPQLKVIIQSLAEGGWIAAHAPQEYGGLQMPLSLMNAALVSFYAANVNTCYPFLTYAAANLILTFGSEELKEKYTPQMFSGAWQGTMALTEPQAGSSLTDITTSAEPTDEAGTYKIRGQKIFISGGEHDAVDNVVHLLLAKIKGAPAGTKGISLFVVPKLRIDDGRRTTDNGNIQTVNDNLSSIVHSQLSNNNVTCAGIYGKMGQKGYIAAHLMYGEQGDCLGYLVGEPNKGLTYMFQMMNEARIGTGLVAAGAASAGYYASLKYANERPQGRHQSSKDPLSPQVLIIEHADIKRQLLFQKAIAEGSIALLMQCSYYSDLAFAGEGEEKQNAHLLLELLTPIAKSYPSEMGILSVSAGIQILGGAGYCDDFPLEQIYRDIRVNAIYEGTTAIHGLDILGRKVSMQNGKAFELLLSEIEQTIEKAYHQEKLNTYAHQLNDAVKELTKTTQTLSFAAKQQGVEAFLSDASLYLEYFGIIVIAWMWLKQGVVAAKTIEHAENSDEKLFYESKIVTLRYFFDYELPKIAALKKQVLNFNKVTMDVDKSILV